MRVHVALFASLSLVTPAGAQRLADARSAFAENRARHATVAPMADSARKSGDDGLRIVGGLAVFAIGTYVGYHVADAILGPCMCDDPGLEAGIYGLTIGGTLGSALGASLPAGDCSFDTRFARGAAGATLGTLAGIGLTFATSGVGIWLLPAFTTIGAVAAVDRCRKSGSLF